KLNAQHTEPSNCEQHYPHAFFIQHITILFSTTPSVAGVLRLKITSLNGALALRSNKVTGTLRKRQESGAQSALRADSWNIHPCLRGRLAGRVMHTWRV